MTVVLISRNIEYRYDMVFIAFDISNVDLKDFKINYDICKKKFRYYHHLSTNDRFLIPKDGTKIYK